MRKLQDSKAQLNTMSQTVQAVEIADPNVKLEYIPVAKVQRPETRRPEAYYFERVHSEKEAEDKIKKAIYNMSLDGYDLPYSTQQSFKKGDQIKRMIRKAYLRFDCPNCDRPGNRRRGRRWTTVCGTVEIEFVLRKLDRNSVIRRDSSLLIFHVNIYRMKCMECHSLQGYSGAKIYDSVLNRIENQFVEIVGNIFDGVKPRPKWRNKIPVPIPDLQRHKNKLCEACRLGKCVVRSVKRPRRGWRRKRWIGDDRNNSIQ